MEESTTSTPLAMSSKDLARSGETGVSGGGGEVGGGGGTNWQRRGRRLSIEPEEELASSSRSVHDGQGEEEEEEKQQSNIKQYGNKWPNNENMARQAMACRHW